MMIVVFTSFICYDGKKLYWSDRGMIRLMTSKDIVAVQQIARETWRETYNNIIPHELQTRFLDRTYSDMMLMKRMEKTTMLIAECDGIPIGFANFTTIDADGDAELTAMYILPNYQQVGHGKKLFLKTLATLEDATNLFVYVDEQNSAGRTFYEKQGFQLVETFAEDFEGYPVKTVQYVYNFQTTIL